MDVQVEFPDADLVDQVINFPLQLVGEKNACLDLSTSETRRALFLYIDIDSRSYALSCDLHQSELRQRQDVVAGTVVLHVLAHALVEQLAVFRQIHVDEVDDDDASHVAQSELPCQFVGSAQVGFQCVLFLSVLLLSSCTAIHVHHVHGLGMFDDEVGSMFVVDGLAEPRLELFCHVEGIEDGRPYRRTSSLYPPFQGLLERHSA